MAKSLMVIKEQIAICNADIQHYKFYTKEKPDNENYKNMLKLRQKHLVKLEEELAEAQKLETE
jgi:hypothetical protein